MQVLKIDLKYSDTDFLKVLEVADWNNVSQFTKVNKVKKNIGLHTQP